MRFHCKYAYLSTPTFTPLTRKWGSRPQTSIFTMKNHHFRVLLTAGATWPTRSQAAAMRPQPVVPSQSISPKITEPGDLNHNKSVKIPLTGFLSKVPQPRFLGADSSISQDLSAQISQPKVLREFEFKTVWGLTLESFNVI